jgi:hypothetical protein
MFNTLNEHRQHYQEQLVHEIVDFDYNFSRYKIDYSVVIAYVSEEDNDLTVFSKSMRKSDRLIILQKNLCAIVLYGADEENGIKAANNLLTDLQNLFLFKHLYMAVVAASNYNSTFQMVHDLFDLLDYELNHNMNNLLLEPSQVTKSD